MKYTIIASLLLLQFTASAQTKDVQQIVDTVISTLQKHSVNSDKVDWKKAKSTASKKLAGIDDPLKLGPVIRYIYECADEFHGAFFYGDSMFTLPYRGPSIPDSVMKEWKKGVTLKTTMLNENIGYIRIPYMTTDEKRILDDKAQAMSDSLCALLKSNIRGLIVDLRLDGGGSMYPMILGLSALLDTGLVGSFVPVHENWYLRKNSIYLDTDVQVSLAKPCSEARSLPVVVLIGAATGSSGEFLAMAFKGRKKTVFIGSPTAGYITALGGFDLREKGYMNISTAYGADHNGKIYKEAIKPDIQVDGRDNFNDLSNDNKVKTAIDWLNKQL
jgi:hypothetical protein